MDAKDHREYTSTQSDICRLEWIAWAMEAARRHKEDEHRRPVPPRRSHAFEPERR